MKQKTGRKLLGVLLTLAMVVGLMPGMGLTAYAAEQSESFTTNKSLSTYTGEYFTITCTNANDGDGFYLDEKDSATISAKNGEIITKVEFTKGAYNIDMFNSATGTVTYNGDVATVSGVNATSLTVNAVDRLQIKAVKVYYTIAHAHTHNFTYEASGATITAKCSAADCTLTANPTLTIVAPTMTAYGQTGDGISASATLTGLTDFNTATGKTIAETNITYVGRDGTNYAESAMAPTNAGKYTAKNTVEGQTASVDYEIDKAQPTTPTGLTATYGQKLSDVTLPTGWSWKDSTQSVGNVGDNTFKANYAPTDAANYYSKVNVDVTVTVGKADPAVPTSLTATYGQTLKDVTLPDGWTWADSTQSVGNVVDPAATFKANFAGDDNHNAASNVDVAVTVGKAAAAPATVTANDRTFDGTEKPLVTVDDSTLVGGTMWYAIGSDGTTAPTDGWDESIPAATDAGTYNVWYKVKGDDNHNDVDPKCVTAVITEPSPMVTTSASVLLRNMTVNWTKDKSVKNYKVAYRKAGSSKWTIKKTSQPGYVVWNQKTRECYEYKVAAVINKKDIWSDVDCRYFNTVITRTKAGRGTITVSWCKDSKSSGYQIMVATNKKMNDAQIINVESTKKSYVVSGLKKGKTYYVRVRPMKLRDDVEYVGILSNTCKVKVK